MRAYLTISLLFGIISFGILCNRLTASENSGQSVVPQVKALLTWKTQHSTPQVRLLRGYEQLICFDHLEKEEIGYAIFNPTTGYLDYLLVHEKHARKGYGKIIFDETAHHMREAGAKTMCWDAIPCEEYAPPSERLNAMYTKWGGIPNPNNRFSFTKSLE